MAWYEQGGGTYSPEYSARLNTFITDLGKGLTIEQEKREDLKGQIADYENLKKQFLGPEATYIRWLIDNKIIDLKNRLFRSMDKSSELWAKQELYLAARDRQAAEAEIQRQISEREWASALEPGQERTYMPPGGLERQRQIEQARAVLAEPKSEWLGPGAPPVPRWMREYMEPSMPRGVGFELRPLGAQAQLGPEELGHMAGYLGWTRAGAPTRYSPEAIQKMADWEKWWEEYKRQSMKLFPQRVTLGAPRWAIRR